MLNVQHFFGRFLCGHRPNNVLESDWNGNANAAITSKIVSSIAVFETLFSSETPIGRDPFNQNSDRSDREKRTTSKSGPVLSKLFRLDRTDPSSFGPKFPEILVEWIAPIEC